LIKRERKIDAVVMFWVLTLSFGVRLQRTLASLKRSYEKESNHSLSDSSWYYRFTPELVAFLKACVLHGTEYLAQEQCYNLNKRLKKFELISALSCRQIKRRGGRFKSCTSC
jgi:putative transposase